MVYFFLGSCLYPFWLMDFGYCLTSKTFCKYFYCLLAALLSDSSSGREDLVYFTGNLMS